MFAQQRSGLSYMPPNRPTAAQTSVDAAIAKYDCDNCPQLHMKQAPRKFYSVFWEELITTSYSDEINIHGPCLPSLLAHSHLHSHMATAGWLTQALHTLPGNAHWYAPSAMAKRTRSPQY